MTSATLTNERVNTELLAALKALLSVYEEVVPLGCPFGEAARAEYRARQAIARAESKVSA